MKSLLVLALSSAFASAASAQVVTYPSTVGGQPNASFQSGASFQQGTVVSGPTTPGIVTSATTTMRSSLPWYQKLTDQREHDFGVVARASKQVHVFEFVNNSGADLFLNQVKTSCGCTKPQILTQHVKINEKARVQATFDTLKFFGKRGATLSVSMQKAGPVSEYAEVQFAVKGTIRRDVVLSPGQFEFQNVNVSESSQRTAKLWYAGKPDWKIIDVKSTNPNLSVALKELGRDTSLGKVNYELTVTLGDKQPAGQFNDNLTIVTNDPATTGMPVEVNGTVNTVINVSPIALGVVSQGQKIAKRLIIRSPEPISIDQIEASSSKIKFKPSEGKKTLHILSYTFDTTEPTDVNETITIVSTGAKSRKTKVSFSAQVVPSTQVVRPASNEAKDTKLSKAN
jgi:hypothetical protein